MKFAFLIYDNEDKWAALPEAERREVIGAHMAYSKSLKDAGAFVDGAPLDHSRNGKRVRAPSGWAQIQDGPFTDAKEQLGGYYIVDAKNLDSALDWAARCPGASYGTIEIRPLWEIPT